MRQVWNDRGSDRRARVLYGKVVREAVYAQRSTCGLVGGEGGGWGGDYKMPESLRAFCNIVSFTAAKTSRIFDVSVACVRLDGGQQRDR